MKLLGENSARFEISRKSPSSDLVEFDFSCEWCAGKFEFFSTIQDFVKLEKLCASIASGKKRGSWLSEEGDLELKFAVQSSGQVRVNVIETRVGTIHSGKNGVHIVPANPTQF